MRNSLHMYSIDLEELVAGSGVKRDRALKLSWRSRNLKLRSGWIVGSTCKLLSCVEYCVVLALGAIRRLGAC